MTIKELLERIQNAPPQPNKQSLKDFINEQEKSGGSDDSRNDP
jgi:hypothetical protein